MKCDYTMGAAAQVRLGEFFDRMGGHLNKAGRGSFAIYAMGILGDGERKSAEPIAARSSCDPDPTSMSTQRCHDRLLWFLREATWSDEDVRREGARYAIEAMVSQGPITCSIVDDTGFLKQGEHSVGVQRQYTGSAGKIANCQLGVSLSVATAFDHVPIAMDLYLPKSWTSAKQRDKGKIPEDVVFKTKPELASAQLDRAVADGIALGVVLADCAYGNSKEFRQRIRLHGVPYAVAVKSNTIVYRLDKNGDPVLEKWRLTRLAANLNRKVFRRIEWREGTRRPLESRFYFERVAVAYAGESELVEEWLVVEWLKNEAKPTSFALATLPKKMKKNEIVNTIKQRWRTERVYQDGKGELGLDHFEGRSFVGWNHHVSVVLACYAFVVAERIRTFPPSRGKNHCPNAICRAA
jgi:SRSO17 transposase